MITLQAPAKINLFLRILDKRPDGYHNIASLMQSIDLSDQMTLELSEEDSFTCSDELLENKDNLVIKALDLFRKKISQPFFVKCHLVKNIPQQAGLGGGSSDAGAMLQGLNQLLNNPLEISELMNIASEIGSDVPFFLNVGSAYCEGRGEKVKKLKPLEKEQVWIIKPSFGLATSEVYKTLKLSLLRQRNPLESLQSHLLGKGDYYNDLEQAAFQIRPELAAIKVTLLTQGFHTVLLSGSGSAFFCLGAGYPDLSSNFFIRKSAYL